MSIWTRLYEHTNFEGRSTLHVLPYQREFGPPLTYARCEKSILEGLDMHDKASSLEVSAHDFEQGGYTILFQHDRYRGRYVIFPCTPGETVGTSELSSLDFNDRTSSVLLVRRFRVECPPLSFKEVVSDWRRLRTIALLNKERLWEIDIDIYGGTDNYYEPRGDPIITWDMWPGFSPTRTYIYVRVPVKWVDKYWFDYDCEIRYWIYLYVDGTGTLRGHVAWYGAWVAGGILTGGILDQIMSFVPSTIGDVNSLISEALGAWEPLSFVRLYYLPGKADSMGHVDDDVSLVLVKEL